MIETNVLNEYFDELRWNGDEAFCWDHNGEQLVLGSMDYLKKYFAKLQNRGAVANEPPTAAAAPLKSCTNCGSKTCGMRAGLCVNWIQL